MDIINLGDGSTRTAFGEIIFFFTVEIGCIQHLAFAQQFLVQCDGRLLYRSGLGVMVVIGKTVFRNWSGYQEWGPSLYYPEA